VATPATESESAPPKPSTSDGQSGMTKIGPNRVVIGRYLLCMQAFQGGNP